MTKIQRRRTTVKLHHGHFESELADLSAKALAALRAEETGPRRASTKSQAARLAKEHDDLLAEAQASAVEVTVWAIGHAEWNVLADKHEPREGEAGDEQRGLNMKTFPPVLLLAGLVDPEDVSDIEDLEARVETMQVKGRAILADLDLSRVHYVKLETAAWNVNVGDDALPKSSLVSLVKQLRDPDSKPPSDSE